MSVSLNLLGCFLRSQLHTLAPSLVARPSIAHIQAALTSPGGTFEVEEVLSSGRMVKSWKNTPTTLAAVVEASRDFGDRDYIAYGKQRLSYAEHYRQVARLANRLVAEFGIEKGDRVAIAMRNYPEWSVAFWAAAAAGAVVVPINAWWTSSELEYGLSDSHTKVVIADQQRLQRIQEIESDLPIQHLIVVRCDDVPQGVSDMADLIGSGEDSKLPVVSLVPEDDATLFYTSGTTGFPKGTLGTQHNFCTAALNIRFSAFQSMLRGGTSLRRIVRMMKNPQVALLAVPLFHVTGCEGLLLSTISNGGKLIMMYKWEAEIAADLIEREKITAVGGVPAMTHQLVDLPDITQRDLSSIMTVASGGAAVPPELFDRIRTTLPNASVSNGYGITETSSAICSISGFDYIDRPDSVGVPPPVCELKVVNERGEEVVDGSLGEFWVSGPNVVKGYWNKPDATAEAFENGWFHTGDIGRIDEEGFVYLVDRLKDMIIRGGENIYCAEVEAALSAHPAIKMACVFGIPDEVLGEQVAAVVEACPGDHITENELREFVSKSLASYKVPATIGVQDQPFPIGATGKILKKELRNRYIDQKSVSV